MALFHQIPKDIKEEVYTHKALYAGIVPVYVVYKEGVDYEDDINIMVMAERNGIPMYSINVAHFLWQLLTIFHPTNPIVLITGEI